MTRSLVLLGGPTGIGKSAALKQLPELIPGCGVLDADDAWQVSPDIGIPENRQIAINNTIAIMKGYFEAGCRVGVLGWVFARKELYDPVVTAFQNHVDQVIQLYLTASDEQLKSRLQERGDLHRLDYARSRAELIHALPYHKIDTTHLTPAEVAEMISAYIEEKTT